MKTELAGRALWFDGVVEVQPQTVEHALLLGVKLNQLAVSEITDEIKRFNCLTGISIGIKTECSALSYDWNIPSCYLDLDIDAYVAELKSQLPVLDAHYDRRIIRIDNELAEFKRRNLIPMFKTIIYIVDTLREKKILWGVGRGSSCASYLLNLVGLHCVDPVLYDISMSEFLHD